MDDEIQETREHLWGSISNKMDKIGDEADRLEWGAVINMVADAFNDGSEMEAMELFLTLYQFMFRLYYRLKAMTASEAFNQVSKVNRLENHDERDYFMIKNYDYKMFKWAIKRKYTEYMTNGWFLIPVDDLSPAEKHNFEKRM